MSTKVTKHHESPVGSDSSQPVDGPLVSASAATIFALASAGLPIVFFYLPGLRDGLPAGYVLTTLVVLAISSLRLSHLLYSGQPRIVTAVMWMMLYISGGVVPLAQAYTGLWPGTVSINYLPHAQLIILAWGLSFELGQKIRLGGQTGPARARLVNVQRLITLNVVASLFTTLYIARLGPASFFASRVELSMALENSGISSGAGGSQVTSALWVMSATVPVYICLVAWTVLLRRREAARTVNGRLTWIWLFILNVFVNNPISNSRYWALAVIVGFVFAMPGFNARRLRWVIPLGLLAALVFFPYSDYFRNGSGQIQVTSIAEKISTKDYDQSTMTANGIWYGETYGHTHGRQLAGIILFAVPRSVWPDKPMDTGVLIGQAVGEQTLIGTTNLSSPAWLEIWLDFGMPGMIAIGILVGTVARRADDLFIASRSGATLSVISVILPLIAGFTFILMRGPLLQAMTRVAVIGAVAWYLGSRSGEDTEAT